MILGLSSQTSLILFLACLFVSTWGNIHSQEDGFTFDLPEDFEVELVEQPRKVLGSNEYGAPVGKVFHLTVPNVGKKKNQHGFVAKLHNRKSLPHWLIFNKKTGIFWGIPLPGDEGILHITVSPIGDENMSEYIVVNVTESNEDTATTIDKCKSNEDYTILTLLLDKNLRAIKPKQRVIAVSNIAKFFRLPYSAFMLKPQLEKDDITGSSVVLAGPGNVQTRTSKITSYLQVLVGCDGRLWETTAPLIYNLKQQARDGTIAEVLRLPLIGWRVKTETKSILRNKRQATVDDYGSGDYDDDYYQDYDEYEDEDDLGDVELNPPAPKQSVTLPSKPTTASTSTATTTTTSSSLPTSTSHPHRHHHGQPKPSEEYNPVFPVTGEKSSYSVPEEPTTSQTQLPSTTTARTQKDPGPTKIDIPKPHEALDFDAEYDYDAYDDEDDTEDDPVESETIIPDLSKKIVKPVFAETESSSTTVVGITKNTTKEVLVEAVPEIEIHGETTSTTSSYTTSSTTTTSEAPTTFEIVEDTEPPTYVVTEITEPAISTDNVTQENLSVILNSTTTSTTSTTTATPKTTTTTQSPTTQTLTTQEALPTQAATTIVAEPVTTDAETSSKSTTIRQIPTTSTTESDTVSQTIEPLNRNIPETIRNFKPYIENRLQYKSVIAGKVFRFVIPKNTFKDAEDGYNLTFEVFDTNEQPISKSSWLQFNPSRRELYGLPLAEDVSNWVYIVRAIDKDGEYEQDQLVIQVQQHRLERVINHEFVLSLRIEKPQEYPHYVDWSLKVLRALGRIYNTNMSEITVRQINHTSEPVVFAWSNDSLPTNYCPGSEIEELFKMLTANDRGDPSRELSLMLAPDLRVKKVVNRDLSICEQQPAPPVTPSTNFSPILRNPVDQVNATLGELLIYKVEDDTFYDPEDVDPSRLNITLQTSDLQPIPPNNWLQFDSKNREFFGIPRKTGRTEYWLVCVDTGGMSAKDSLEVVVQPAAKKLYNVEFSMTIEGPYETFSNNAAIQKKFVEKLMEIFEETSSDNFHFLPFKPKREQAFDSTVVIWFNKSLPIDKCPTEEIKRLEYLLHNSDSRSISSRVHRIMGPDFTVSTIKVHHLGNCKSKPAVMSVPEIVVPVEETTPPAAESEVMVTFIIPIIIISIMLFVAAVAACVLYRKRRMGKMNVEEDGRQSYGNKGIPVIFQEELEEKPEPGTKAPVILKDEKPPLAPPEYSKSGSVKLEDSEPYQPPPPFTRTQDNGRQPRPKPTPTYRKPPPYVPP